MKPKSSLTVTLCIFMCIPTLVNGYQISLTPGITISEEYNDNIFLTADNEEDDFITSVIPYFTLEATQRNNGLELTYSPGYSFYANNSEFDGWNHDVLLGAWIAVTRNTRIELEDAFLYTQDPNLGEDVLSSITEDPLIQGDPTLRRGREPYYTNTASARMIHQFGASDSFFVAYSYDVLRNDDPEVEDVTRHIPSVGVTYWFLPRWGLEVEGSLTDTEPDDSDEFNEWYGSLTQTYRIDRDLEIFLQYEQTAVKYSQSEDEDSIDYQVFEPSLGVTYNVLNDILLSLRLGYFWENSEREGEDVSGLSGNVELTKTLRNGSISIIGDAGQENTVFSAENLGFTKFYEIGSRAEYMVLRNVSGDISVSFRKAIYEETEADREDEIIEAGAGLSYQPTTWLLTRLEYLFRTLDSTLPEDEYAENRILFNVTLTRSQPYRLTR